MITNSKKNNYIEMRNQMRTHFLSYDQEEMIRKFDLAHDEEYLYIRFWNRPYRIGRTTGIVEWSENQFRSCTEGDYNESLTIYDVLCYSKPGCYLSGEYAPSNSLKGTVYTGMVAMGFCGGSWADVRAPCRLVLPKIDDCVSLLLQTTDAPVSNLKKADHLYVREKDTRRESFHAIFERMTADIDPETKKRYHQDWMRLYRGIAIMDTAINNSRSPEYRAIVQEDADWLQAELSYVPADIHLLKKLLEGNWDAQFLVLEKDQTVEKEQIII